LMHRRTRSNQLLVVALPLVLGGQFVLHTHSGEP
jgi:hypothetical protein